MKANYNPFKKKETIETEHGIINKTKGRYFTHRRPEHYFKKFQGFGISKTEIQIAQENNCDHIIIKYHGKKKNILFKIRMIYLKYMQTYNYQEEEQYIIPEKEMEKVGEEIGLEEHEE